jgi:hypothetical protein
MTHKLHYLDIGLLKKSDCWKKNNKGWSMYKSSLFYCISAIGFGGKQRVYTIHCSVGKTSEEYTCKVLIQA